ncbi:MAG: hypothetical protein ACK4Z8_02665 [Novosphingobium sp.]
MSYKRLETLNDYRRHRQLLRARCRECKHVADFDPAALVHECLRRNQSIAISAIEARLRCEKCGARGPFVYPTDLPAR